MSWSEHLLSTSCTLLGFQILLYTVFLEVLWGVISDFRDFTEFTDQKLDWRGEAGG